LIEISDVDDIQSPSDDLLRKRKSNASYASASASKRSLSFQQDSMSRLDKMYSGDYMYSPEYMSSSEYMSAGDSFQMRGGEDTIEESGPIIEIPEDGSCESVNPDSKEYQIMSLTAEICSNAAIPEGYELITGEIFELQRQRGENSGCIPKWIGKGTLSNAYIDMQPFANGSFRDSMKGKLQMHMLGYYSNDRNDLLVFKCLRDTVVHDLVSGEVVEEALVHDDESGDTAEKNSKSEHRAPSRVEDILEEVTLRDGQIQDLAADFAK
jgi:hypothetical protein